jgi:hypothetical protein
VATDPNVHRVAAPPGNAGGVKRLSMVFFHHPNYDALIECVAPSGQAKYTPVLSSGEYRDIKNRQTRLMEPTTATTACRRLARCGKAAPRLTERITGRRIPDPVLRHTEFTRVDNRAARARFGGFSGLSKPGPT